MKKLFYCFALLLVLCVTAGCSSQETGDSAALSEQEARTAAEAEPGTTPEAETKPEISTEKLLEAFQQNYTACGGSGLETDGQIGAELTALGAIVSADDSVLWPEDFERQYRDWRGTMLAEKKRSLREEYKGILRQRDIYDGWNSGVYFAQPLDFDADGWEELLLVNILVLENDTPLSPNSTLIRLCRTYAGWSLRFCRERHKSPCPFAGLKGVLFMIGVTVWHIHISIFPYCLQAKSFAGI